MKVKNTSSALITLRNGKAVRKIKPLETIVVPKANEEYAKALIEAGKLKEIVTSPKSPATKE